tara:strand:+ start:455 stop:640 length:186 start_codon:yes stop_codon:yes gene_type:complete
LFESIRESVFSKSVIWLLDRGVVGSLREFVSDSRVEVSVEREARDVAIVEGGRFSGMNVFL